MAIKVYLGKQTAEGTEATTLLDLGATDFSGGENYTTVQSEVFNDRAAAGDRFLVGVDTSFSTNIDWSMKVLEAIMPGLSYTKTGADYKMNTDTPAYYTVVVEDTLNNEKTKYVDAKANNVSINVAIGAIVNGSIDWIGKKAEIVTGTVTGAQDRGESLVAISSVVNLGGTAVTEDVSSLAITFGNSLEAKGSLDSVYTRRIVRNGNQTTELTLDFNYFAPSRFKSIKQKALQNASENLDITLVDGKDSMKITFPKLLISSNERGDYKGEGSQSISLSASVNNADKTPAKFTFTTASQLSEEE